MNLEELGFGVGDAVQLEILREDNKNKYEVNAKLFDSGYGGSYRQILTFISRHGKNTIMLNRVPLSEIKVLGNLLRTDLVIRIPVYRDKRDEAYWQKKINIPYSYHELDDALREEGL